MDLALSIGLERERATAVERAVQQEVERIEIGEFVTVDIAFDHAAKVFCNPVARHELLQYLVPSRLQRDHTDVGGVTFVARACVRNVDEAHFHWMRSTLVFTTDLSTSAGQYATISSTLGRPPANPVTLGGPFRTSGAISRVNRSTAARSGPRTPKRSCTSGAPLWSPARRP